MFKIAQSSPSDVDGLQSLIDAKALDPNNIVAILGKTEGNGCVNDFTRGFAIATIKNFLATSGVACPEKIVYIMSGGTEGILSPHITVFTREMKLLPGIEPRNGLVLGVHHTRSFTAEELGRMEMVKVVADGVREAMQSAGLDFGNVHFVQVKCPLIKSLSQTDSSVTQDAYKSMAYSRAASALGVAVAMQELELAKLSDDVIMSNFDLYSNVASTSAGLELTNCEIVVMGNAPDSQSSFVIGHSVMQHALDVKAVAEAMESAKSAFAESDGRSPELVNVFAKSEADPTGLILNCRHTMLDDSDINHTRMIRAVVGAAVASVVQDPMIYVSGGAEHQGPPGGGPVAVIYKSST